MNSPDPESLVDVSEDRHRSCIRRTPWIQLASALFLLASMCTWLACGTQAKEHTLDALRDLGLHSSVLHFIQVALVLSSVGCTLVIVAQLVLSISHARHRRQSSGGQPRRAGRTRHMATAASFWLTWGLLLWLGLLLAACGVWAAMLLILQHAGPSTVQFSPPANSPANAPANRPASTASSQEAAFPSPSASAATANASVSLSSAQSADSARSLLAMASSQCPSTCWDLSGFHRILQGNTCVCENEHLSAARGHAGQAVPEVRGTFVGLFLSFFAVSMALVFIGEEYTLLLIECRRHAHKAHYARSNSPFSWARGGPPAQPSSALSSLSEKVGCLGSWGSRRTAAASSSYVLPVTNPLYDAWEGSNDTKWADQRGGGSISTLELPKAHKDPPPSSQPPAATRAQSPASTFVVSGSPTPPESPLPYDGTRASTRPAPLSPAITADTTRSGPKPLSLPPSHFYARQLTLRLPSPPGSNPPAPSAPLPPTSPPKFATNPFADMPATNPQTTPLSAPAVPTIEHATTAPATASGPTWISNPLAAHDDAGSDSGSDIILLDQALPAATTTVKARPLNPWGSGPLKVKNG